MDEITFSRSLYPPEIIPPQKWMIGFLKEEAAFYFSKKFLPPKNKLGNRKIFYCIYNGTPAHSKIIIATGFKGYNLKVLTANLAYVLVDESSYSVSPEDQNQLNQLIQRLKL